MSDEPGLFEVMYSTRAMRKLKPDPVPEDILLKLVDAGNQGPTGSNMQNVRWLIVRDADQKRKLADLNRAAVTAYVGAASATPAAASEGAKRQRMVDAVVYQMEHLHEAPALIIACAQFDQAPGNAAAMAGGSVWPAVQNVLLAARALGLGAAPTTLGLSNRAAAREVLGLPPTVEAYVLIPVGYPMGKFGPVTRLPIRETVRWDRWS